MVCRGKDGSRAVPGRTGSHDVQREGWVSWCARGGMGPMVYTGRDESHPCPPGLEATGRARGCSVSTEHALPLDSPPAQDFLTFLSLHLCVKDYIQF